MSDKEVRREDKIDIHSLLLMLMMMCWESVRTEDE